MRSDYVSRALFWCVLALITAVAVAEEASSKFKIRVGGAGLTGSEEYRIEGTASRYRLNTEAALARIQVPVLVLAGGKDIQVTKADYDLLLEALRPKPSSQREAHWFPSLNHFFMPVEGQSTGAEYGRAGNVAPELVQAIATWVKKRSGSH